jgi:hypothetical protein
LKKIELGGHQVVKTLKPISKNHGMKIRPLKNHFKKNFEIYFLN